MSFQPIEFDGPVGKSVVRRSGREKVTGAATFTAEWPVEGLLHGVLVQSTVARGKIRSMDLSAAEKMRGVRLILTPDNFPKVNRVKTGTESNFQTTLASNLMPCGEREIFHAGQYVAAVVADTFENARDAALAVQIEYERLPHQSDVDAAENDMRPPQLMGAPAVITVGDDAEQVIADCSVSVDQQYPTAGNQHHPIEPHAAIADWRTEDAKDSLTVYETTQSLVQDQPTYAKVFGLSPDRVRVVCKYIGGAFGSKGLTWPHAVVAVAASKLAGAPVKVVTTRRQQTGGTGHRSPIRQRVAIGADENGKIRSIIHSGSSSTSRKDMYIEAFTMATRMMYQTDALKLDQKMCRVDTQVPTFMRAPAEVPGMFALESAIDELAVELEIDPIDLRIRNEPDKDLHEDKPFSGRHLVRCLKEGAAKFGWQHRDPKPRSNRQGDWLIGTGVAAATYPVFFFPVAAKITASDDGRLTIRSCTHEMGTGTVTTQSQLLADLVGVPAGRVSMELGDTTLPPGNLSGGSSTACSVGAAVRNGAEQLRSELVQLAKQQGLFAGTDQSAIVFDGGGITDGNQTVSIEDLLQDANRRQLSVTGKFSPAKDKTHSAHSFGAHFVEVGVDEELGLVRVRRMLGCFACGTILNARTARSQFIGGMIMGVGHALQEAVHWDHRYGRVTNTGLGEYHVPVNADIPDIDVMWIDTPDFNASPIGAKGIGEIGITGLAAAVANAVYHATGRRIRQTPITPESVMVG